MTYFFGPGHYNVTDDNTARVYQYQPGGAAAQWFLGPWPGFPLAAAIPAANCIAAYRAVDTVGSPWGAGPANLAASYVNLNAPGVNDAAPGVAPTWSAAAGWTFNGTTQYLQTVTPADGYTIIMKFSGHNSLVGADTAVGMFNSAGGGNAAFLIQFSFPSLGVVSYSGSNGVSVIRVPNMASGSYAIANKKLYRNGVHDGADVPAGAMILPLILYVGALNENGAPVQYWEGGVQALHVCNISLDAFQIAALGTPITGAMAQL